MSTVNWNKAPEWATHYGPETESFQEAWYLVDEGKVVKWATGDILRTYESGGVDGLFPNIGNMIRRPDPWSGEGLPPVGTICQYRADYLGDDPAFSECEVIAHFDGETTRLAAYVFTQEDGTRLVGQGAEGHFKPYLTPKQIAEQERQAYIQQAIEDSMGRCDVLGASYLYEAGYRKQEAS